MEEIWLLLECLNILIQIPISPQCCNIYLLIYWLCWVVMCGVCTSCGEQGYSPVAVCGRAGLLSSGCVRASRATLQWLCAGEQSYSPVAVCGRAGLLSSGCVQASGCSGFSRCGTWASGTQASVVVAWQALWLQFSGPGAWAL